MKGKDNNSKILEKASKKKNTKLMLGAAIAIGILIADLFLAFIIMKHPSKVISDEELKERTIVYQDGNYSYRPSREELVLDDEKTVIYYGDLLNVFLMEAVSDQQAEDMASAIDGKLVGKYEGSINKLQIMVPAYTIDELETMQNQLMEIAPVLSVLPEVPAYMENDTDDQNSSESIDSDWWIEAIRADEAWKYEELADDYSIGILDTGFDLNNTIFRENGESCIRMINDNSPDYHGTETTAFMCARNGDSTNLRGIADRASVIAADITTENGVWLSYEDHIALSTQMIDQGVKVINNSWGNSLYSESGFRESELTDELAGLLDCSKNEITYDMYLHYYEESGKWNSMNYLSFIAGLILDDREFLIVESSGNGYDNGAKIPGGPGYDISHSGYTYRGINETVYNEWWEREIPSLAGKYSYNLELLDKISYENIKSHLLIVGSASNSLDDEERYAASNYSNYGENVDILAPGDGLRSFVNPDELVYGTSISAPMVSASAAFLWALDPSLSSEEVKRLLTDTSHTAIGTIGSDAGTEYPMLNIGASIINYVKEYEERLNSEELIAPYLGSYINGTSCIDLALDGSGLAISTYTIYENDGIHNPGEAHTVNLEYYPMFFVDNNEVYIYDEEDNSFKYRFEDNKLYVNDTVFFKKCFDDINGIWIADSSSCNRSYYLEINNNYIYYLVANGSLVNGYIPRTGDATYTAGGGVYTFEDVTAQNTCTIKLEDVLLADEWPTKYLDESWTIDFSSDTELIVSKSDGNPILGAEETLVFEKGIRDDSGYHLESAPAPVNASSDGSYYSNWTLQLSKSGDDITMVLSDGQTLVCKETAETVYSYDHDIFASEKEYEISENHTFFGHMDDGLYYGRAHEVLTYEQFDENKGNCARIFITIQNGNLVRVEGISGGE